MEEEITTKTMTMTMTKTYLVPVGGITNNTVGSGGVRWGDFGHGGIINYYNKGCEIFCDNLGSVSTRF